MADVKSYDFIVIGSGFGGSVSALRLMEKGYKVAIIEKGKRYRPEDYAKTSWNLRKFLWRPEVGLYGIQYITFLKNVLILHGAGYGGGSLVYANQLLTPPDEFFKRKEWGSGDWKTKLMPFYDEAKRMLGATPCPAIGKADEVLAEVGKEIRGEDTFHINDVGVFFDDSEKKVPDPYFGGKGPERKGCTFCGACMVGCRDDGKNTLDKNYLYLAEQLGLDVFSETEVTDVSPSNSGYELKTRKSTGLLHPKNTFHTANVVFSGGVMGTFKLLAQCKDKGHLPNISDRLGDFTRTNSETLLGVKAKDRHADYSDALAITSGIYPDDETHIEIVRYNKGSDSMGLLTTLLVDGGGWVPRPIKLLGKIFRHPLEFLKVASPVGFGARVSILLVMQTTENYLKLNYKRKWWRFGGKSINSKVAEGSDKIPTYFPIANKVARRMAEKMDAVAGGTWNEVFGMSITAHILGACSMGETADKGVVDFKGRVHGYPGLYIADGSVIPANLGVNPSLTITALSEYIMSEVPAKN